MGLRGRYAPSPTGPLHLGNLRSALLAWLQVRLQNGTLILRMEDLDEPRCSPEYADSILADLDWLGFDWDEGPNVGDYGPYTQSERTALYHEALQRLRDDGRIYPCYCSRKDIREAASAPHGRTLVYPGTCRDLTPDELAQKQAEHPNRKPAFRFRVDDVTESFVDEIAGTFSQNMSEDVGDFVVLRRDGIFAYQLAVVVDDIAMEVTDVLRGEDLLESTPRQIHLYKAFGEEPPRFWHVPLMSGDDGEKLSKRDGADSLQLLRDQGHTPKQVITLLARSLGWDVPDEVSAIELLNHVSIEDLRNL